jgi:hypothetical protein
LSLLVLGLAGSACAGAGVRAGVGVGAGAGRAAVPAVVRFESVPGSEGTTTLWAVAPAVHLRVDVVTFRAPFHCLPLVPNRFTRGQVDVHCTPDLARPVSSLFVDEDGLTVTDLGRSRRFPEVAPASTFELPAPPRPETCAAGAPTAVDVAFDRTAGDLGWAAPALRWKARVATLRGSLRCAETPATGGQGTAETCSAGEHHQEMRVTPEPGLLRLDAELSGAGDERRVTGYISLPCGAELHVSTRSIEDP